MVKLVTETPLTVINENFDIGLENWDDAQFLSYSQLNMDKLFRTVALEPGEKTIALPYSKNQLDVDSLVMTDPLTERLISGQQLLNARVYNDALLVMHKGQVVHESYRNGMLDSDRHVIHSTTKSHCAMLVAIAIEEGLMDEKEEISVYIPELKSIPAWHGVNLGHVLDMVAGLNDALVAEGKNPIATMDVADAAKSVLHMAELPLASNVQFMTVMATKMPYIGRG